ncbi:hypothetical protein EXP44_21465 [Salmonella enterica subsp. enterica serovar Weltevreden]|uniref:Uncharacterized protein n=1 Tax=Salmonella enterica subsp. enterica serovar Weltevreden TaxID=57743 RepID=A0A5X9QXR0_SALET|nr:hypothetical protein [Salmonella enterica]ECB3742993.1 hypothetical protein [Salmonella enterica subsp. enterica serovar Akanji]ECB4561551.1 hypothetical protein [Salmonella enterica subsp. enterica serovar Weltevreden]ECB6078831.1 hypothetical protein [Salmonella enterica subsp. enterica serovar Enteritidis]ECB6312112.1 hypothetical protein [Salmonella enterica subsp. enterica serovar Chailey]ECB7417766.1 hypothetical protein [Salmonella enterica subsp. enterica serovar Ajiobo]ECD4901503.
MASFSGKKHQTGRALAEAKRRKTGCKARQKGEENVKIFQLLIFLIKNKALLGIHLHYLKRG